MGYAAGVGDVFCIPVQYHKQIGAAGITALAGAEAPCNCRVWRIDANVDVLAGAVKCTDADLTVYKSATALCSAMALVNTSTKKGVVSATLAGTASTLALSAGDDLNYTIALTGGTTPTIDGLHIRVWCIREN